MKFKLGQLVILARPEALFHMQGSIGEVLGLPGCEERYPLCYHVDFPEYRKPKNHRYLCFERQLDPLDNHDNRTPADTDNLIFNPKILEISK